MFTVSYPSVVAIAKCPLLSEPFMVILSLKTSEENTFETVSIFSHEACGLKASDMFVCEENYFMNI